MHSSDVWLFYAINHGWANGFFDWLMPFVSAASKIWSGRLLLIASWLFLLLRCGPLGRRAALALIPAIVVANLLADYGKAHIGQLRPCVELSSARLVDTEPLTSGGMPSGHAANTAAAATVVFWFFRRKSWGIWFLPLVTGLSRVYVGVHYPSQVLGGWLLGGLVGLAAGFLFRVRRGDCYDAPAGPPVEAPVHPAQGDSRYDEPHEKLSELQSTTCQSDLSRD